MKASWIGQAACAAVLLAAHHVEAAAPAEDARVVQEAFHDADGDHSYAVMLPTGFTREHPWPVILFLHGAGERGSDGRIPLSIGLGPVLKQHPDRFPAIVVFPQAEELHERIKTTWSPDRPDGARALKILAQVEARYPVDANRRILTGWSMGGFGAWRLAAASEPGFWSAVLPVAGGAPADVAGRFPQKTPLWAINGADDRLVPASEMTTAINALPAATEASSSVVPGMGHDVWIAAYSNEVVQKWMFDPPESDPHDVEWDSDELSRLRTEYLQKELPFVPQSIVSRAVAVRIGNEAFAALGAGLPENVSKEKLRGELADLTQSIDYNGERITATIAGLTWTTELASVEIRAVEAERLRICVGLRNLTLSSTGAKVEGGPYRASTGPFEICIGAWSPVVVEVVARPRISDGKIRLNEQSIEFRIPDGNWIVRPPETATASGPKLTPELVKIGVVGGMYRAKGRVEETVRELIVTVLRRIEERLKIVPPESLAEVLWPLPTAPPRIRLRPEAIRTDNGGVSLTLGMELGVLPGEAVGPVATRLMTAAIDEQGAKGVSIGIAPHSVAALAETFRRTSEARIDVLDTPESELRHLSDRSLLENAIPDLHRFTDEDVRTELILTKPFELQLIAAPQNDAAAARRLDLRVVAPEVVLRTSKRARDPMARWQPCANFMMSLEDQLTIAIGNDEPGGRRISVAWGGAAKIAGSAQFAEDYQPQHSELNADPMLDQFRTAWTAWTASMATTSVISDLGPASARLHLEEIPARGGRAWLEFRPRTDDPKTADAVH